MKQRKKQHTLKDKIGKHRMKVEQQERKRERERERERGGGREGGRGEQ